MKGTTLVVLGMMGLGFAAIGEAQAGLVVDLPASRTPSTTESAVVSAVKTFNRNAARLTARERTRWSLRTKAKAPFSLPTTVNLRVGGKLLEMPNPKPPGDFTLVFDSTGTRSFPATYRTLLQSVFDTARPTLNAVFGVSADNGAVRVANYDADIGDRDAVSGGYYVPNNGSGAKEIRFPVYNSPEAAAVNFLHTLLLAYYGANSYGNDAFQEGLVRAAVMRVVRTPGALPATLNVANLEAALDATYDVGSYYDWYNQRALGGKTFIAPNLRSVPLPAGGSLGGIYLLRYQMAGSAWQKAIAENPGFIRALNERFYATPTADANVLAQQALNAVSGTTNATIEGLSFANWRARQAILETNDTRGQKLLVQPLPITSSLGGQDYGVFDVAATYFETQPGGNEVLLSGTSYPIFWDQTYNRIFPSTQEDVMPIAGAYGSVTPNIPNINGNQIYRATVDIPVSDRIARAYIPVGAIATAANPTPRDFFGTVVGSTLSTGQTMRVRVSLGAAVLAETPVTNAAFGTLINTAGYLNYARLKVDVIRRVGTTDTILLTRFVNKGPGPLALDLRVGGDTTSAITFPKGIQAVGLVIDPYSSLAGSVLNVTEPNVLAARYNSTAATYDLYPDTGPLVMGNGYFMRVETAGTRNVPGRTAAGQPIAIALKPGWNLIGNPHNEAVAFSRAQIVRTTEAPKPLSEALGVDVGSQLFQFVRGVNNAVTGAPETGSYGAATNFPAGQAVFIRCLAPEGATLLLSPSTAPLRPGNPFVPTGWSLRASLVDGAAKAEMVLAASGSASRAFDPREDSGLPPRFVGGLNGYLESTELLARDARRINVGETYKLRFDGLTIGKTYTVSFARLTGTPPSFLLRNKTTLETRTLTAPASYSFVAKSASQRLEVLVNGGGQ
jgi:hypothetical protein